MKVYNKEKTQELIYYDLEKGYLKEDSIVIGQRENNIEENKNELGEVISKTYYADLNIYENCYIYIPYTEQELNQIEMQKLKRQLADMDYKSSKYVDGEYTQEEWAGIVAERKAIREKIRELEKLI